MAVACFKLPSENTISSCLNKRFNVGKLPELELPKVGEDNDLSCAAILAVAKSLLFPDTSLPKADESAKFK